MFNPFYKEHGGMPNQVIIFSEHKKDYSGSHDIKLLNLPPLNILDLNIKTEIYGNFFVTKSDEITWIGKENVYFFNPLTKLVNKQILPRTGVMFKGRNLTISGFQIVSISPSGNKFAYLFLTGTNLYIGGSPKIGGKVHSLGFKSELHVFDLVKNEDSLIVNDAADWGPPQWSSDESKILYTRPESDNYFDQSYLDKVVANDNISWQAEIQSAVFVYDFNTGIVNKLCLGINPQWSPDGEKIAFLTENNKIGIYDLRTKGFKELLVNGYIDPITFRMTWSSDQKFIAYLGNSKYSILLGLIRVVSGSWYARPMSLWVAKTDGTGDRYIETRNFGDIKFAPEIYKRFLKDKRL
jgi:Tol biopolymer transport system component